MNRKITIAVFALGLIISSYSALANEAWEQVKTELKKDNTHFDPSLCEVEETDGAVTSLTLVNVAKLDAVTTLEKLESLTLKAPRYDSCVVDYSPLNELGKLKSLTLERQWKLASFETISELEHLEDLTLVNTHSFKKLDLLDDCRTLKKLSLERCNAISNVKGVYKSNIESFSAVNCRSLKNVAFLPFETLKELTIIDCPILSINSLRKATRLVRVNLDLEDVSYVGLGNLPELEFITLNGKERTIDSLSGDGTDDERENNKITADSLKPYLINIKEGETEGIAFLARDTTGTYIYTNQHFIRGEGELTLTTADGISFSPSEYSFAQKRDILRFKVSSEKALSIRSSAPGVGDNYSVVDSGEKERGIKHGSIIGVGPVKLELSKKLENTMFGSPILDADMKVLAVASVRTQGRRSTWTMDGSRFAQQRNYGHRFNNVNWIVGDWKTYKQVASFTRTADDDLEMISAAIFKWFKSPVMFMDEDAFTQKDFRSWIRSHHRFLRLAKSGRGKKDSTSVGSDFKISYRKLATLCERREKKLREMAKLYNEKQFSYHAGLLENYADSYGYLAPEIEKQGYIIFTRSFQ